MPVPWKQDRLGAECILYPPNAEVEQFSGRSDQIAPILSWMQQRDQRRLVLIGPPGSGKTTLAIQLLLAMLREPAENEPVPVMFSLGSWNPLRTPRISDFIAGQLLLAYPGLRAFGSDVAIMLCESRLVLPVLDGLDEVSEDVRPSILRAISATLAPECGIVLTCRREEYYAVADAAMPIPGAAVLCAQHLDDVDAVTYLRESIAKPSDDSWSDVLERLDQRECKPLLSVIDNPLGLWLVVCVYVDGLHGALHPTDLISERYSDPTTLRNHLFEHLIPAAISSRPPNDKTNSSTAELSSRPRVRYEPEDVKRWLAAIAKDLSDRHSRDWKWWELAEDTFRSRRVYLTIYLVECAVFATVLISALVVWGGLPVLFGAAVAVPAALYFFLINVPPTRSPRPINRSYSVVRRRFFSDVPYFLSLLLFCAIVLVGTSVLSAALGFAAMVNSVDGGALSNVESFWTLLFPAGVVHSLAVNAAFVFVIALLMKLVGALDDIDPAAQSAWSPLQSYKDDRLQLVPLALLNCGVQALFAYAMFGVSGTALAAVVALSLAGSLLIAEGSYMYRSSLVLRSFRPEKRLPWNLPTVLDDIHRLGLLRTVGPAYQFRHAEMQDFYATSGS